VNRQIPTPGPGFGTGAMNSSMECLAPWRPSRGR